MTGRLPVPHDPPAENHIDLAERLRAVLAEAGHRVSLVEIGGIGSGGATRTTWFVTIHGPAAGPVRAVAQVSSPVLDVRPVGDEAALIDFAARAGVPVPQRLAVADNVEGLGSVIVTRHVDGLTIPRHILRSLDGTRPAQLTRACGRSLAALHTADANDLPGTIPRLDLDLRGADYVDDLAGQLDALPVPLPSVRLGLAWLRRHLPSPPPSLSLIHGDFRNGNLIVDEGRLAAVIDWELAHIGDPMEDLAYLCLRAWRYGNDDLPVGGFGNLADLRAAYEAAGGTWRDDAFRWWTVARTAWWALGLARQADAYLDGRTDSIVLAASGRRVVEQEYDLLRLIAH